VEIGTLSLITQVIVFFLLCFGYLMFRKGDLKGHGAVLTVATFLHIGLLFLRMFPAFFLDHEFLFFALDPENLAHWGHVGLGLLAPVLGIYLSLRWVIHGFNPKWCAGKTLMRIVFLTWFVSLVLGFVIYVLP
jgi:uncharacterized membrane protein YozB (DUF420 family)